MRPQRVDALTATQPASAQLAKLASLAQRRFRAQLAQQQLLPLLLQSDTIPSSSSSTRSVRSVRLCLCDALSKQVLHLFGIAVTPLIAHPVDWPRVVSHPRSLRRSHRSASTGEHNQSYPLPQPGLIHCAITFVQQRCRPQPFRLLYLLVLMTGSVLKRLWSFALWSAVRARAIMAFHPLVTLEMSKSAIP